MWVVVLETCLQASKTALRKQFPTVCRVGMLVKRRYNVVEDAVVGRTVCE